MFIILLCSMKKKQHIGLKTGIQTAINIQGHMIVAVACSSSLSTHTTE